MNKDNEDHVLKSLFEMTGIQSALQHDQIMDSASHDTVFVEREGKKKMHRLITKYIYPVHAIRFYSYHYC